MTSDFERSHSQEEADPILDPKSGWLEGTLWQPCSSPFQDAKDRAWKRSLSHWQSDYRNYCSDTKAGNLSTQLLPLTPAALSCCSENTSPSSLGHEKQKKPCPRISLQTPTPIREWNGGQSRRPREAYFAPSDVHPYPPGSFTSLLLAAGTAPCPLGWVGSGTEQDPPLADPTERCQEGLDPTKMEGEGEAENFPDPSRVQTKCWEKQNFLGSTGMLSSQALGSYRRVLAQTLVCLSTKNCSLGPFSRGTVLNIKMVRLSPGPAT